MDNAYTSRTERERQLAARRRMRRELAQAGQQSASSMQERWITAEAVEAALALEAYFRDEWRGYGHAAALAAATA